MSFFYLRNKDNYSRLDHRCSTANSRNITKKLKNEIYELTEFFGYKVGVTLRKKNSITVREHSD